MSLPTTTTPESSPHERTHTSRPNDTFEGLSEEIFEAINRQDWKELCNLMGQRHISDFRSPEPAEYPAKYRSIMGEYLTGFRIDFDKKFEKKIARAISRSPKGYLPLHRFLAYLTESTIILNRLPERITRSISILGGFGPPIPKLWQQKGRDGKNALHIAASGHGTNLDHALRALLELVAMSPMTSRTPDGRLCGLDDKTTGMQERTALHLAALNEDSKQPFDRLLLAGANPWVRDSNGNTILHRLSDGRRIKSHRRKTETIGWRTELPGLTAEREIGDNIRIGKIHSLLHQTVDWTPGLDAVNYDGETATRLALSTKDYKVVDSLTEARCLASYEPGQRVWKIWEEDAVAVLDLAVLDLDEALDDPSAPIRISLMKNLARDPIGVGCFNKHDNSGMTALHKACDLTQDRADIVKALLDNGAEINKRTGHSKSGLEHSKRDQYCNGLSALSFAASRGHRRTVSFLLAKSAPEDLDPAECSIISQAAYEGGNPLVGDLIQYFRRYDSGYFHKLLDHAQDSNQSDTLATKWPSKATISIEDLAGEEENVGSSRFSSGMQQLKDFDYHSYPEKLQVGHIMSCADEDPENTPNTWNTYKAWNTYKTWNRKNGGWIHLPANDVSIHQV